MKIIWTFNPFEKNSKLHDLAKKILISFFNSQDKIEALYVATNSEVELATAFSIPVKRRYSTYPENLIKHTLKKMDLNKIKVRVLFENSLSLTAAVKKVTDYAKKENVDLMLIASNSKKNLPRMIFGSFAESIVHLSVCDILIFHQKMSLRFKAPTTILYGYDFSPKGYLGLERIIFYAKKWNSHLIVLSIPMPDAEITNKQFEKRLDKQIVKIEKTLEKEKVNFSISLNYDVKPITETILDTAKKSKADIIAVSAKANRLEAFLGGSITRQVLRVSSVPVLVLKV